MDAIIERMSGGCPEHPLLKIVENHDFDRSPSASEASSHGIGHAGGGSNITLPRQRFERLPATDRFCGVDLWPDLDVDRGSDHTWVRFEERLSHRRAENFGGGATHGERVDGYR